MTPTTGRDGFDDGPAAPYGRPRGDWLGVRPSLDNPASWSLRLGTIWGIMRAFQDMSAAGSTAPTVVASGVAEALLTTAAGIVIAVPAILAYNHYTRRMNVMLTVAENGARSLRAARARVMMPPIEVPPITAREMPAASSSASTSSA